MFCENINLTQFNCLNLRAIQQQRGFNLIEVLITLIVLAVGLLGLATLQNLGLRFGHQSYERTQATILIYDIIDRMRANPTGVIAGNYITTLTSTPPTLGADCAVTFCNSVAMATYDLNQWLSNITGTATTANPGITRPTLIGGQGEILRMGAPAVAGGGTVYDIKIQWLEQRQGETAPGTGVSVAPELMSQTVRVHLP